MKNFNELTKQELANLSEIQVDAYIDLELANQNVVKEISYNIDFPDYIKPMSVEPEKDLKIYQVDGYNFLDKETAEKFSSFVGTLQQISLNYEWECGSDFYYAYNQKVETPIIQIKSVYSKPKFEAIKSQLKTIKQEREKRNKDNDKNEENAINYEAIDNIKQNIRSKVREAIIFFEKAKQYANNYEKYFAITEDKEKALNTIFTVFNIQDDEMKEQIKIEIEKPKEII